MSQDQLIQHFQTIEDNFNKAWTTNNIEEISKYISPDWTMLEPQFGIVKKEQILDTIKRGDLLHSEMKKKVVHVKVYDDIAIVTNRGMNVGSYKGEKFNSEQWVTNTYNKKEKNWICVMTQEAPVSC